MKRTTLGVLAVLALAGAAVAIAQTLTSASSAPTGVVSAGSGRRISSRGCFAPRRRQRADPAPRAATERCRSRASWPSSYFSGPLGKNEVLPARKGHTLLSMWSGVEGYTAAQQRAFIHQRITDMRRVPDIIVAQCNDGRCSVGSVGYDEGRRNLSEDFIHSLGAIPAFSWEPDGTYAHIAGGREDSQIDAAAARFKAFGHRIMVRPFHEFDSAGSWSTTDFINAWRHVVTRMRADGATNVGFVWCFNEYAGGNRRTKVNASYPGDRYVDWVSSDSYNWDTSTAYAAGVPGWHEFNWMFNYSNCPGDSSCVSKEQQHGPTKPFFVWETNTKYDTAGVPSGHTVRPNRKANWYRNIPSAAARMPYLIGVDFFDQDITSAWPDDWRVDHDQPSSSSSTGPFDQKTYQGFLDMARSTQFSGGVAGGDS
jgi:hypothetical protein